MSVKYADTSSVRTPTGPVNYTIGSNGQTYAEPDDPTFLGKIARIAPYGIMAGFGYGALGDLGVLGTAGAGGAGGAGYVSGAVNGVANAASGAASGAGMAGFGSGTLANYFSSPQGLSMLGQGGFNLAGSLIQSHANSKAAQLQAQAAQAALDFAKQQYAIQQQQNAPFLNASTGAVTRLTDLLNHPPQVQQGQYGNTVQPYASLTGGSPQAGAAPQAVPATSGGQMVTLQSPDGKETQQFPSGDPRVAQYLAKGARRI